MGCVICGAAAAGAAEIRQPALVDHPQPLGFLPTRRFWQDPENRRLAGPPFAIIVGGLIVVISLLLDLPWWAASLVFLGAVPLMLGLFERYIRHAAKQRFHSQSKQATLAEGSNPPDA